MAHRVHRVVRLVAVHRPVARRVCDELDRAHLADGDIHRDLGPARLFGHPAAVGAGDLELEAVDVDRVIGHGQVAHAHAHALVEPGDEVIDAGKHAAVPGPQVEVEHGVDARGHRARLDVVSRHQEAIVAVDPVQVRVLRMHHQRAHHAHRHLHHFVGVRVIHEGARLLQLELVGEGLAGRNLRLVETAHAVHAGGQEDAVPVDRRVLGQAVGHENPDLVALDALDGRPRRLAVVAPEAGGHAGRNLALHRLCGEVKFLPAVFHAPR